MKRTPHVPASRPRALLSLLGRAAAIATLLLPALPGVAEAASTPTMTVYLPNITRMLGGPAGWQTPFIVQNVGSANTDLEISFYRFDDGSLVAQRRVRALRPGTSFADVPNNDTDLPAGGQFSVVVRSYGAPVVSVVNQHQGAGSRAEALSYVGLGGGAKKVHLPYVAKMVGGWLTTFIIQNVGAAPTTVTIRLVSSDGTPAATLTRSIQPGRSQFVDPRAEATLRAGTEYAVTLTAAEPIAVVANAHNDWPETTAPMGFSYNGVPETAGTTTYLPYVARNADGGRSSRILVQNAGSSDALPTLEFRRGAAAPTLVSAPRPVAPGAAWAFDVRAAPNGSPCPAQGGTACLADGEHALVVRGGQFAVLNATLNPRSAVGYTGSADPRARISLPNVTRTLGGPAGWTTPIVLQSAGASRALARWYRFSDGTLAHTQELSGLSAGAAVRIDPRTVPALSDDSQYAVVIEGIGGPLTAIVIEFAEGGDNAMVYEGFSGDAVPATPAPPASSDPNAYFRPIPGYVYVPLPEEVMADLRSALGSQLNSIFTGMAARSVTQGGTSHGLVLVFTVSPSYAALPNWENQFIDGAKSGTRTPTVELNLAGRRAIFVDTPRGLKMLLWTQGNHVVFLLGMQRPQMEALAIALINANR